jgi:hypothetical protein
MADLSPWQRGALDALYGKPDVITPFRGPLREGCLGLVRKGLAAAAPPGPGRFRITDAGMVEWRRRHPETQDAA